MTTLPSTQLKSATTPKARIASLDAYRGLVMFLMLAEVLRLCAVSAGVPDSGTLGVLCYQQTHAAWVGCSLHDLIQPSFYFLVGAAVFISITRRLSSGQSLGALARHTLARSVMLVVLGMCMVAIHPRQWVWDFADTLTQIGLAFPFLVLIALRPVREWLIAFCVILVGYWLWFALFPLPPPGFDYAAVGVPSQWVQAHGLTGFAAHWQKNSNAAAEFDRWFINLFPVATRYVGHPLGLATLNFIPSIATMILGLFAARTLRSERAPWQKWRWFFVTGLLLVCGGWLLGAVGVCPVVKAIWTPSWVLFSGGLCVLLLAAFYALVDVGGLERVAFPLTVIGMNSMVAYVMSHVYPALAFNSLQRVVGVTPFQVFGAAYEPVLYGGAILVAYWLVLFVLYRQRIFLRI